MNRKQQNAKYRPSQCSRCGSRRVYPHGTPKDRRVKLIRFRCWECGKTHNIHTDPIVHQLSGLRIKQSFGDLVRDFGLLALGLPVNQIRNLTGRKTDTLHRTLDRCRNEPDLWDAICLSLKTNHDFIESDLDRLEKISKGEKDSASPFQMAFGTRTGTAGFYLRVVERREVLCARIERLIGGQVAYASTGEFWRADVDVAQNPWIRKIRVARDDQLDHPFFDPRLPAIANQVRHPNARAQALALQGATAPAMTLRCLCDGVEPAVSLPMFMDAMKAIVRSLTGASR